CYFYPSFSISVVPTPFLFFSFYRSPLLRVLHSFPTRRSSDLLSGLRSFPLPFLSLRFLPYQCLIPRLYHRRLFLCHFFFWFQTLDRKSTRLNSSHVSISYAVFCLKKKNKKY